MPILGIMASAMSANLWQPEGGGMAAGGVGRTTLGGRVEAGGGGAGRVAGVDALASGQAQPRRIGLRVGDPKLLRQIGVACRGDAAGLCAVFWTHLRCQRLADHRGNGEADASSETCSSLAATSATRAESIAGSVTKLTSMSLADEITIAPSWFAQSLSFTPTEKPSLSPSAASTKASDATVVFASLNLASMPVSVTSALSILPIGLLIFTYIRFVIASAVPDR